MITINRGKKPKEFYVRITAKNGETLMHGEMLKSRAACKKQIIAVAKQFTQWWDIAVQDNTGKVSKIIYV